MFRRDLLRGLLAAGAAGALLPVEEIAGLFAPRRTLVQVPRSYNKDDGPLIVKIRGVPVTLGEWTHSSIYDAYEAGLWTRVVL